MDAQHALQSLMMLSTQLEASIHEVVNSTMNSNDIEWHFHLDILPSQLVTGSQSHVSVSPTHAAVGMVIIDRPSTSTSTSKEAPSSVAVCLYKEALPTVAKVISAQLSLNRGGTLEVKDESSSFRQLSLLLLCVSPMSYSIWNDRKRWLRDSVARTRSELSTFEVSQPNLQLILFELYVTSLVLSKFPKVPEVFAHRLWVAQLLIDTIGRHATNAALHEACGYVLSSPTAAQTILRAADKHSRNYPLWFSYVLPCVRHVRAAAQSENDIRTFCSSVVAEYLPTHPKDHSATQCLWTIFGEEPLDGAQHAGKRDEPCLLEAFFAAILSLNTKSILRETAQYAVRLESAHGEASTTSLAKKVKRPCHSDEGGSDELVPDTSFGAVLPVTEGAWEVRKLLSGWYLTKWRSAATLPRSPSGGAVTSFTVHQMAYIEAELQLVSALVGCDGSQAPWPVASYALQYGIYLCHIAAAAMRPF